MKRIATISAAVLLLSSAASFAGQAKPAAKAPATAAPSAQLAPGITPPNDYVIGAGDVLIITYWKDTDMTTDAAVVRPDGMITLPLLNDVPAMGLKPEQLRDRLMESSAKLLEDPRITVGVRAINSRKVYISGGIAKPGQYDLLTPMTVFQLISVAGGTKEYADVEKIMIIREEGGKPRAIKFNLKEMQRGIRLEQNIPLKPGDTISVPE